MKKLRYVLLLMIVVFICNVTYGQECRKLIESAQQMGIFVRANVLAKEYKNKAQKDSGYQDLWYLADMLDGVLLEASKQLSESAYNVEKQDTSKICYFIKEFKNYQMLIDKVYDVKDKDSVRYLLGTLHDDLNYKYWVSGRGGPSAPPTYKTVLKTVKVRVLNSNGIEIPGYSVYVKPELSINSFLIERFNPTNNAVKAISPGRKLVWIEKGGKIIKSAPVGIRLSDEENKTVDFVID